jgi:hypothetical protein
MNLFDLFFEITRVALYIYPICGVIIVIIYLINKNGSSRNRIRKISGIVNSTFGIWLTLLVIVSSADTKKKTGNYLYENDPTQWVLYCSVIAIIIALFFKQIRTSPFSLPCMSIILLIELLIMAEMWKIVV